jgi:hypothetical protein
MGIVESNIDNNCYGYRIYKLFKGGPLEKAGLKEFEDFIIPPHDFQDFNLKDFLNKNHNTAIQLKVYNLSIRNFYKVSVVPMTLEVGNKLSLGATVVYENYLTAMTNVLQVLKVNESSLARKIGLTCEDYIIGIKPQRAEIIPLNSKDTDPFTLFTNILQDNLKKTVEIYVYNIKEGGRSLSIHLDRKDNEILGCQVGYGVSYEFPIPSSKERIQKLLSENNSSSEWNFTNKSFLTSICLDQSYEENHKRIDPLTISPFNTIKIPSQIGTISPKSSKSPIS